MKFCIHSSDASRIDGTNVSQLFSRLPKVADMRDADATIVAISFFEVFKFNENLLRIDPSLPVIVVNYMEFGWNFWCGRDRSFIFGDGNIPEYLQTNPEWAKLDQWIASRSKVLTFQRELLAKDSGPEILPISFLCMNDSAPEETREQFENRPYEVLNIWGHSHPSRPRLHGDIFNAMAVDGINVVSDWCQLENMPPHAHTWLSVYSPYWCRKSIQMVLACQRMSKISISMPGAGAHCFRHSESPVDCVMAMLDEPDLAYPFPWSDRHNCIKIPLGKEVEHLLGCLKRDDLYQIYLHSRANIDRYRPNRFVNEYFLPKIQQWL